MAGALRMENPIASAPRMDKLLNCIIRKRTMPGASYNIEQRLEPFGKICGGVEALTKVHEGMLLISNLRRKDE
jgi:hypothetical protein